MPKAKAASERQGMPALQRSRRREYGVTEAAGRGGLSIGCWTTAAANTNRLAAKIKPVLTRMIFRCRRVQPQFGRERHNSASRRGRHSNDADELGTGAV